MNMAKYYKLLEEIKPRIEEYMPGMTLYSEDGVVYIDPYIPMAYIVYPSLTPHYPHSYYGVVLYSGICQENPLAEDLYRTMFKAVIEFKRHLMYPAG